MDDNISRRTETVIQDLKTLENFFNSEYEACPVCIIEAANIINKVLHENDVMREQLASVGKKPGDSMEDVRKVVLCKKCKHNKKWYADKGLCDLWCNDGYIDVFDDGFCSYGEHCPNCGADMRGEKDG